jgi:hypothetical protein
MGAGCGTSGEQDDAPSCFSGTPCVTDGDCGSGEHCNTSLQPGTCMALFCGQLGAPCDEDAVCATNLVCGDRLTCQPPGFDDQDTGEPGEDVTLPDTSDNDATNADDVGDADDVEADADAEPVLPLRYVRIDDLTTLDNDSNGTAGADIHAIELDQGGRRTLAVQVDECTFGSLDNATANDCNDALNSSGASCNPATPEFVSLGGEGGSVVVSFGVDISPSATIRVYECGTTASPTSTPEHYSVSVGTTADPTSEDWFVCLARGTDITSCTVPTR